MGATPFQNPFQNNAADQTQPSMPNTSSPFGTPGSEDDFSFDLTNATSSAMIQPGWYLLRLADISKETARSGNPMWVFSFEILSKQDGTPTPQAGRTVKKFCALTENALGILADTLDAIGLGGAGQNVKFSKADAINRMCFGEMVEGEYNNQKQTSLSRTVPYSNRGQKYNAASAGVTIPQ